MPSLASQPIRAYPLRQINEPGLYVAGDKVGQKVLPGNQRMGGMGPHNMLAQQNREMEALERRSMASMSGRPRSMSGGAPVSRGQPMGAGGQPQGQVGPKVDDDDDDGELLAFSILFSPSLSFTLTLTPPKKNRRNRPHIHSRSCHHTVQAEPRAHERSIHVRRVW